jgi:hypothetical protein
MGFSIVYEPKNKFRVVSAVKTKAPTVVENLAPAVSSSIQGLTNGGPLRKAYEAVRMIPSAGLPTPAIIDVAHNLLGRPAAALEGGIAEAIAPEPKFTERGENIAKREPFKVIRESFIHPETAPTIAERVPYTEFEKTGSPIRLAPRAIAEGIAQMGVYDAPFAAARATKKIGRAIDLASKKATQEALVEIVKANRPKIVEALSKAQGEPYVPDLTPSKAVPGATEFDMVAANRIKDTFTPEQIKALERTALPRKIANKLKGILTSKRGSAEIPDFRNTNEAFKFGLENQKDTAKIAALQQLRDQALALSDTVKDPQEAINLATKAQLYREAIEAAEGKISPEMLKMAGVQANIPATPLPGETSSIPSPEDTSFNFGSNVTKSEPILSNMEIKEQQAVELELTKEFLQSKLGFRKEVGKLRRYDKNYLKEELDAIPNHYWTKDPNAERLDERAQAMGFESDMALRDAIVAYESFAPQGQAEIKDINAWLKNFSREVAKNKAMLRYIGRVEKAVAKYSKPPEGAQVKRAINAKPPVAKITIPEDQALRIRLRAEQKAAKGGYKAGTREGKAAERETQLTRRASIIERLKIQLHNSAAKRSLAKQGTAFEAGSKLGTRETRIAAKEEAQALQQIKNDLKKEIIERLPLPSRGKFINQVATARTPAQVSRAFRQIDAEADRVRKRKALADLKITARRIMRSQNMAIDLQQKAQRIIQSIQMVRMSKRTAKELQATKEFVERQRAQGKPVDVPKRIIEKLARLEKVDPQTLKASDIENLVEELRLLEQLGKTKLTARIEIYEAEKKRILDKLVAGSKPVGYKQKKRREVGGDPLSVSDNIVNFIAEVFNRVKTVDIAISPTDVMFDLADGSVGYTGANHQSFKRATDINFSGYMNDKDAWQRPIQALAVQLKLKQKNLERIGIHVHRMQEGGVDYLLDRGLTQEQINAVKLTEPEQKWYEEARKVIEEPYPNTLEKLRVDLNRTMGKIENYWPIKTDADVAAEMPISERMEKAHTVYQRKKNVEQGFTKERVGGAQAVELNAMTSFLSHMDDVAYFLNMERDIRMLTEIAKTPEYGEAVNPEFQQLVLDWLDVMARKGGSGSAHKIPVLDMLRRNTGASRLGFKLSSILIQPTALLDGAALLGPGVFRRFEQVVISRELRQFLRDNFPELRNRGADDPAYLDLSENATLRKYQQAGYWPLQQADLLTASGVLLEAYTQALAKLGQKFNPKAPQIVPEAITQAQQMMRRTQSSAFFKDQPLALSKGKLTGNVSLDRAILQFKSFLLNRWSIIRHDAARVGLGGENKEQAVRILMWLSMATVAETGIRAGSRVAIALAAGGLAAAVKQMEEESEDWTDDLIREALGIVPLLGDFVSMATYRGSTIPLEGGIRDLAFGTSGMMTGVKPETKLKGAVRAAEGIGAIAGLSGSSQAGQLARKAIDENFKTSKRRKKRPTRKRTTQKKKSLNKAATPGFSLIYTP